MRNLLILTIGVAIFAVPAMGQVRVEFRDDRFFFDPIEPLPPLNQPLIGNPVVVDPVIVQPVVPDPVFPTPRIPVQVNPQVPNPAVRPDVSSFGVPVNLTRVDRLIQELGLNPFDPVERETALAILADRGLLFP